MAMSSDKLAFKAFTLTLDGMIRTFDVFSPFDIAAPRNYCQGRSGKMEMSSFYLGSKSFTNYKKMEKDLLRSLHSVTMT